MTPAQFVRKHYPKAQREQCATGFQVVANGETLAASSYPNRVWTLAARHIADAQSLPNPRPWEAGGVMTAHTELDKAIAAERAATRPCPDLLAHLESLRTEAPDVILAALAELNPEGED